MGNIEIVLLNSITVMFFAGTMWYGSKTRIELFGPTHYRWDNEYFHQEI